MYNWYVDKKPVYNATRDIPRTPGKIMMNVWNGKGVDEWLKPYNGVAPLTAQYDRISYTKPTSGSSNNNNNYGGNIRQWNYYGNPNQEWKIETVDGYYKPVNRLSGKALDVEARSTANCANVIQWDYSGGWNQQWSIIPA